MQQSRKPCLTGQPARIGVKPSTSRLPLRNVIDLQDADKSSNTAVKGLYIESQIGKGHSILSSKTPVV